MHNALAIKDSPEWVRLSLAATITLGFRLGLFFRDARLTCINVLMQYSEGCRANCLYCGQARGTLGGSECKNLIRVEWPSYPLDEVVKRTKDVEKEVKRVCVSMITHSKAHEDILTIIERFHEGVDLPISALITPTLVTEMYMEKIKDAGAKRIGIAVDAATPQLFHRLRGKGAGGPHLWDRYLAGIKAAVKVMGKSNVGCHLIVGLGETEEEMASMIQRVHDMGAETHLFSFFPEQGSALEERPQPPLGQYRRVQLVRYLIDQGLTKFEQMEFDGTERITSLGIDHDILREIIKTGRPFETSGCPGCNRPYANERPGKPIRNYPFLPTKGDVKDVERQIWRYEQPLMLK